MEGWTDGSLSCFAVGQRSVLYSNLRSILEDNGDCKSPHSVTESVSMMGIEPGNTLLTLHSSMSCGLLS